jgi:DNA-binding MarR family transcriptional regulator
VAGRLQHELQQTKPFVSVEEEAHLNIRRTADLLAQMLADLFEPYHLTGTQYNVLRILRGAGEAGLHCRDIGERMLNRDPDITRLLDRLAKRGLITRMVSNRDRRALTVRISPNGLALLKELDGKLRSLHKRAMRGVDGDRLHILIEILEDVRAGIEER